MHSSIWLERTWRANKSLSCGRWTLQNSSKFHLFRKLNGTNFAEAYMPWKSGRRRAALKGAAAVGRSCRRQVGPQGVRERPAKDYRQHGAGLLRYNSGSRLRAQGHRVRRRRRRDRPCLGATTSLGTLPRAAETGRPSRRGPSRVECHVSWRTAQTGFSLLAARILSRRGADVRVQMYEGRKAEYKAE